MTKKTIWFPHLILQRNLGVKDLRQVNFKVTLPHPNYGDVEAWQPNREKPSVFDVQQAIDDPELLDRNRFYSHDRNAREPFLTYGSEPYQNESGEWVQDILPVRGQEVFFEYKGYSTFLFQAEYDLISDILPFIQEITINTTDGLSPLFQVLAVLKKD